MITFIFSFLLAFTASAQNLSVAIIDTGSSYHKDANICGAADFTNTHPEDTHGHGSNISSLIIKHSNNTPHCQYSMKFHTGNEDTTKNPLRNSNYAIALAIALEVDMIVYAGGAYAKDTQYKLECRLLKAALKKGIIIVAAAGNGVKTTKVKRTIWGDDVIETKDPVDITKTPYFPAMCDSRIIVASCTDLYVANTGKAVDVKHDCIGKGIPSMSGTSQATGIEAGLQLKKLAKKYEKTPTN